MFPLQPAYLFIRFIDYRYVELLAAIRPQAVNLVDSFDLRDEILASPLGCWDGNVYQSMFFKFGIDKQSFSYELFVVF